MAKKSSTVETRWLGSGDAEVGRRLKSAMQGSTWYDKTQKELVEKINELDPPSDLEKKVGLPQSSISMYFNGERNVPYKRMVIMAKLFNVSVEWLYTGRGPRRPNPLPYDELAEKLKHLHQDTFEFINWLVGNLETNKELNHEFGINKLPIAEAYQAIRAIMERDAINFTSQLSTIPSGIYDIKKMVDEENEKEIAKKLLEEEHFASRT